MPKLRFWAGLLLVVGAWPVLAQHREPPVLPQDRVPPRNTGNPSHERLASAPADDRVFIAQVQLVSIRETSGCTVAHVAFRAFNKPTLTSMWRADCKDGRSFILGIAADAEGTTRVVSCTDVENKTGMSCF
jgi:hypothetical protein